jgi:hypothetical protein
MPPRFSFNTDLTSSVNALSNQTWFKHFSGWWTAHLPYKIGGKKNLCFCPHKNYPFKTFIFQKLETKKHLKKFIWYLENTLYPLITPFFPQKKGPLYTLKRIPLTPTTYGQKLFSNVPTPPCNSTKTCWENLRRLFYWVCPKWERGIGGHFRANIVT